VEASVRTANKRGFKHKPKTAVEVGLLVAGQLQTLNDTMRGIYDIMRSKVRALMLFLRSLAKTHANYMCCSTAWTPLIPLRLGKEKVKMVEMKMRMRRMNSLTLYDPE